MESSDTHPPCSSGTTTEISEEQATLSRILAVERPIPLFPKPKPWVFWRSIGSPTTVLAPMVAGSDLTYRTLVRRYGVQFTYTPMVNTHTFLAGPKARAQQLNLHDNIELDTPLAVQFATHSPEELIQSIQYLPRDGVSCVDINLGCPQRIAQKGRYGAYLLSDIPLIQRLVRVVHEVTPFVVTAKVRALESHEATLGLCRMLVDAGCAVIAVHARSRAIRQASGTPVDLELLKILSDSLPVPIIANGGVDSLAQHRLVMERTGCAATMAGMGLLRFPQMYTETLPADTIQSTLNPSERMLILTSYMALIRDSIHEYIELSERLVKTQKQRLSLITSHVFKMLAFLWGDGTTETTAQQVAGIRSRLVAAIRDGGSGIGTIVDECVQLVLTLPDEDVTLILQNTRFSRPEGEMETPAQDNTASLVPKRAPCETGGSYEE